MKQTKIGLKNLDKEAYHIVCNWYKVVDFNPVYHGIDYSLIIRFYLWDKIGRAIRIKHGISDNEVELYQKDLQQINSFYHQPFISNGTYSKPIIKTKASVFIPFPSKYTEQLYESLKTKHKFKVFFKHASGKQQKHIIKAVPYKSDTTFANLLYNAFIESLAHFNLSLYDKDYTLLKEQIEGAVNSVALSYEELKTYKPNAVFVHSDNHPPYINYVLNAKKLGIPTFTYQHGLDCEHYYLDDCFADYIAVWSDYKKNNYISSSTFKPTKFAVIGNHLQEKGQHTLSYDVNSEQKTIVYITRPHKSIKCYSPSRVYHEGKDILNCILELVSSSNNFEVIIKPHPMDEDVLYENLIKERKLEEKVTITNQSIKTLVKANSIIITEDSTAGVEALKYSLPCIHAHFANSNPVLPFLKYEAAYLATNPSELEDAFKKILNLSAIELQQMRLGQQKMITDLIPDGRSVDLANFITENVK